MTDSRKPRGSAEGQAGNPLLRQQFQPGLDERLAEVTMLIGAWIFLNYVNLHMQRVAHVGGAYIYVDSDYISLHNVTTSTDDDSESPELQTHAQRMAPRARKADLMERSRFDPISVVECSYALQGTESEWIDRLLESVAPAIDQGSGVFGFTYRWHCRQPEIVALARVNPDWARNVRELGESAPDEFFAAVTETGKPCMTFSQQVAKLPSPVRKLSNSCLPPGLADLLAVHAAEPNGGLYLMSGRAEKQNVPPRETARWRRITTHMAAALRLRRRIEREAVEDEAVLAPSGSVLHATGCAKQADARGRLRDAARAMDRARGPLRRNDPQEALDLWRALCDGRWSLVDRFESDGRRYVIAHRNEPNLLDLRGLSQREATVAAFAQLGQSNKEIAYTLGLSPSSVATHLSGALRKLGLRSRAALAATSFGQRVDQAGDQRRPRGDRELPVNGGQLIGDGLGMGAPSCRDVLV